MNEIIIHFLSQQTCATIGCSDEQGKPYCFNCFYAFNKEEALVYFKSSAETRHGQMMQKNKHVSGTVLPDKINKLIIKGLQLEGVILDEDHPLSKNAEAKYHLKHPMALAMPGEVWTLQLNAIKMTDSTLGFGKKICWNRSEAVLV